MYLGGIYRKLSGRTAKDVAAVFAGNFVRSVLGFVSNLLAIRWLGPIGFGTVASAQAVMTLTAQAVDFGMSTSSVRYGSKYLETDPDRTSYIFKLTLLLKILLGLPVILILLSLSPSIAAFVFGKTGLEGPLRIAFAGSFCFLMVGFPLGVLQTMRRFKSYMLVAVVQGAAQVSLVIVLILTGSIEPEAVIVVFAATPFVAFLVGLTLIPRTFLRAKGDAKSVAGEILGFGKWVTISTFATMFIMRLDILMLTAMSDAGEVGRYAGANQLAYLLPLITGAMTTALLPKATGLTGKNELREYVKTTLRITPLAALLALPLLLFAEPLVKLLFGDRFLDAVEIFRVLLLSFLLSVILNPASLALYSLDRADLLAYLNLVQLAINFGGNLLLIPIMGGLGAALSSLAVRIFGGLYILYYLRKFLFPPDGS